MKHVTEKSVPAPAAVTPYADLPLLPVLDADFWQDPHAAVRAARAIGPVARTPWNFPVLLDYDDCVSALADPRLINDYDTLLTRNGITDGPLWDWWKLAMLNSNPPHHTRLRALVSRAFTPRAVSGAVEPIRSHTTRILDAALERGHIELVHDLCEPLPIAVMCELIGVPRSDHQSFDRWIVDLGLMFAERITAEMRATAEHAMCELSDYVRALVATRRANGLGNDLLDGLIAAEEAGDRLSEDELVAMVVNLLFGALDTTRGALSMSVAALVNTPERLAALRADPAHLGVAVEELLRFEPPIGELSRIAATDLEVCGLPVAAGTVVAMSTLGANRDPRRFSHPDELDLRRYETPTTAPQLLSFGRGIHHCVGSALARLELREALDVLLERCGTIEPAGPPPRYIPFLRVRSMESLPLTIGPTPTVRGAR
jgi:cytochrome P450